MSHDLAPEEKPQRQVDSVVRQLAGGNSSLGACSLVSKRWHARCGQQSFRWAELSDLDDLLSWSRSPSFEETPDAPRTTDYDPEHGHLWITSLTLQGHCFKPFDPIQSLTLSSVSFTFFDSHPPQLSLRNLIPTVRNLHLLYPTTHSNSLFRFLSAFTALDEVTIHAPHWMKGSDHDHCVGDSTLSCRILRLSEFDDRSNSFLSLLGSKSRGYEKVAVINCDFHDPLPLQTLISSSGKTMRRLQIEVSPHANAPVLSLTTCEVLEQIFVAAAETSASFLPVASTLSSVTSLCFQKLILELRTTAQREPDCVRVDLVDRLSRIDGPLSLIARIALEGKREVSLVLLGRDPEFLAQGFTNFQSFGRVWAGEEVGKGDYFWMLSTPKDAKRRRVTILDKLFRRKASN